MNGNTLRLKGRDVETNLMEIPSCPVCQSKKSVRKIINRDYQLTKCLDCGLLWDSAPPLDTSALYEEEYYNSSLLKGGYGNYSQAMKLNSKTFRHRLISSQSKIASKGWLLDVGCALGDCLIHAKDLGWEHPLGLDVSEFAIKFASSRDLSVFCGSLINHSFQPNSFDLLLLQDVIEHIADPLSHLKAAYQLLKPGGWIYVVTPDVEGLWSKLLGSHWYHYKPKEHLTYFSKSTMKLSLHQSGFTNMQLKSAVSFMSIGYVFERMRYYQPTVFLALMRTFQSIGLGDLVIPFNIGELEAWGQKPI